MLASFENIYHYIYDMLTKMPETNKSNSSVCNLLIISCLFVLGMVHWYMLFPDSNFDLFKIDDWYFPYCYYSLWQEFLRTGQIPYQITPTFQQTNYFLAIPELIFSPQVLLLKWMSLRHFALVNVLLLYAVGFIGSLCLKKTFRWSLLTFIIFFLLFNLNGFIVAHISIGHYAWTAYFLLPFFCLQLNQLSQMDNPHYTYKRGTTLALVLFFIFLQGAFHFYIWCLIFLVLFLVFNNKSWKSVLAGIFLSALFLSFRLMPAIFAYYNKSHYHFITGFPTFKHLLNGLISISYFNSPKIQTYFGTTGSWEFDMYISLLGFAFIVYFGIVLYFKSYHVHTSSLSFHRIELPVLLMIFLSMSYFYAFIGKLPLPLLNAERISSRFFIIPLLFIIIVACTVFQQWLNKQKIKPLTFLALLLGVCQLSFSLLQHSYHWRMNNIARYIYELNELPNPIILTDINPTYKYLLLVSGLLSLISVIVALIYLIKNRHC